MGATLSRSSSFHSLQLSLDELSIRLFDVIKLMKAAGVGDTKEFAKQMTRCGDEDCVLPNLSCLDNFRFLPLSLSNNLVSSYTKQMSRRNRVKP
jgi:uncharacterized protein YkvS